ncbi:MAG: hypothetical protein DWQ10_06755, partial [Calditrichaeota bacterium]
EKVIKNRSSENLRVYFTRLEDSAKSLYNYKIEIVNKGEATLSHLRMQYSAPPGVILEKADNPYSTLNANATVVANRRQGTDDPFQPSALSLFWAEY